MTPRAPERAYLWTSRDDAPFDSAFLVDRLRGLLGARLVAVIAGVQETRLIHEWAAGNNAISDPILMTKLQLAFITASLLADRESPAVAQAWMQGKNPVLEDQVPALLLRNSHSPETGQQILAAARAFTTN